MDEDKLIIRGPEPREFTAEQVNSLLAEHKELGDSDLMFKACVGALSVGLRFSAMAMYMLEEVFLKQRQTLSEDQYSFTVQLAHRLLQRNGFNFDALIEDFQENAVPFMAQMAAVLRRYRDASLKGDIENYIAARKKVPFSAPLHTPMFSRGNTVFVTYPQRQSIYFYLASLTDYAVLQELQTLVFCSEQLRPHVRSTLPSDFYVYMPSPVEWVEILQGTSAELGAKVLGSYVEKSYRSFPFPTLDVFFVPDIFNLPLPLSGIVLDKSAHENPFEVDLLVRRFEKIRLYCQQSDVLFLCGIPSTRAAQLPLELRAYGDAVELEQLVDSLPAVGADQSE